VKPSDRNHLARLVAWVQCEIGQTPDEYLATMKEIAPHIDTPDDDAKARIVAHYDRAKATPQYVRAALKALSKLTRNDGSVVDGVSSEIRSIEQQETRHAVE